MSDSLNKAVTRVPLNSPLKGAANPSYRKNKKIDWKPKIKDDYSWTAGNDVFRRYANGQLDLPYACQKIFEALERAQYGGPLNGVEAAALSIVVPGAEKLVDSGIANTTVRVSDQEKAALKLMFMTKYREAINWNVGLGGGSVSGRSVTRG